MAHFSVPVLCNQLVLVPDVAVLFHFKADCFSEVFILFTGDTKMFCFVSVRFHSPNSFSPVGEESRITSILSG